MFGSVSEHFANLRHVKRCKTCVWGVNAVFRATEATKMVSQQKHPFYTIRPKTMFGSVPEHFANIQNIKWCKTCVSFLNALFRGTKIVKLVLQQNILLHQIENDVWECFWAFHILSASKKMQNLCLVPECAISGNRAAKMVSQQKHPFYTSRPKAMFGSVLEHFTNLQHEKDVKLVFRVWMHYFGVP